MNEAIEGLDIDELPVALDAMLEAAGVGWSNVPADTPLGLRVWVLLKLAGV